MPQVRARGFPWLAEDTLLALVEPLSGELSCCSCGDLVGTLWGAPCRHRFCTRCLEPLLGQDSRAPCPIDASEILRAQLLADNSVQAQASQLKAHCPNGGCMATPPLCNLEEHTKQCVEAPSTTLAPNDPPVAPQVGPGPQEADGACWMANLGCDFTARSDRLERQLREMEQRLSRLEGMPSPQLCGTAVVGLALLFPRTWARLVGTPGNAGDAKRRPTNRKPSAPEASLASLAPSIVGSDQELVCPDGILNWRLSDYGRAKRKERHGQHRYTTSPRFYTAEPGYLMQLRVHLHGLGHKGKFVAVQLVLHRGRHDNQLPWPFRHRVGTASGGPAESAEPYLV
ncbi:hypothetical protein HPB47_001429 [Ixodes persulcatus]|uniref:Uncharacterized protein n=1 Tax=Ixodes persulcatus TaxID=34615 RepID=A0AC60PQ66_IXOPE|nr:hypothetical protein HPB47_001429 [Ixodes persulcatus]